MNQENAAQEKTDKDADVLILDALDKIVTVLRKGLQDPFFLYTDDVMQRLMKDIAPMD